MNYGKTFSKLKDPPSATYRYTANEKMFDNWKAELKFAPMCCKEAGEKKPSFKMIPYKGITFLRHGKARRPKEGKEEVSSIMAVLDIDKKI